MKTLGVLDTVRLKLGDVEWDKLPLVPVIVTVLLPVGAKPVVDRVKVLVDEALAGLKIPDTPLGNPEMLKLTLPEKPFNGVMVTVTGPLVPCPSVNDVGETEILKSAVEAEASLDCALWPLALIPST